MQRELVQSYKAKIYEQDDYIGVLKSESEYFKEKNAKYVLRNVENEQQIKDLNNKIEHSIKFGE